MREVLVDLRGMVAMGSKNKRAGRPDLTSQGGPPHQEVDRLIAMGWFKDAVKQAKICQRDHPSPEHHRLLERAYLLRAQELRDGAMTTAAREVAGQLLDFGVTDPDLTEPLATLLVAVGMASAALKLQGRLTSPEAIERLSRQAADQAVLHPEQPSATPEIFEGAQKVRSALEALAAGDEAKATEALRPIARASPFADWRFSPEDSRPLEEETTSKPKPIGIGSTPLAPRLGSPEL